MSNYLVVIVQTHHSRCAVKYILEGYTSVALTEWLRSTLKRHQGGQTTRIIAHLGDNRRANILVASYNFDSTSPGMVVLTLVVLIV